MWVCIPLFLRYNDQALGSAALLVQNPTNLTLIQDTKEYNDNKMKALTAFLCGTGLTLFFYILYNIFLMKHIEKSLAGKI